MKQLVKEFVREMVKGATEHDWARLFRSDGGKEWTFIVDPMFGANQKQMMYPPGN